QGREVVEPPVPERVEVPHRCNGPARQCAVPAEQPEQDAVPRDTSPGADIVAVVEQVAVAVDVNLPQEGTLIGSRDADVDPGPLPKKQAHVPIGDEVPVRSLVGELPSPPV